MNFIRWFIIGLIFYLIFRLLKNWSQSGRSKPEFEPGPKPYQPPQDQPQDLVQDPQCGLYFPRSEGVASAVGGQVLYFCSKDCRDKYLEAHREKS